MSPGIMVSDPGHCRRRPLSTWNQMAMRAYVRQVFCFPLDNVHGHEVDLKKLRKCIIRGLSLAATHFPHFAGRVCLDPGEKGKVLVSTTPRDAISLKLFDHRQDQAQGHSSFTWSYPELKAQGFPCKAFVGPLFNLPYQLVEEGDEEEDEDDGYDDGSCETRAGIPATEVHARVIQGGLLLCFYFQHSLTDGIGMCNFVSTFAAYTFDRNEASPGVGVSDAAQLGSNYPSDIDVDIPEEKTESLVRNFTFDQLMSKCPEYTILPLPTGPTMPPPPPPCIRQSLLPALGDVPKTGRIFRFSLYKIALLKSMARLWANGNVEFAAGESPSTFACLAALTWSFCTAARLAAQPLATKAATSNTTRGKLASSTNVSADKSHLMVPASWRRRAFRDSLDGYASNAVGMVRINAEVEDHTAVANPTVLLPSSNMTSAEALGKLICLVDTSITAMDEKFVVTRTAMFRAAPDPRFIGVNSVPENPLDFVVNSWRHLGGDIKFNLPGFNQPCQESGGSEHDGGCGRTADAVRRAQPAWNMGAGLVLPGKKDDDRYEILVTLDEASMNQLLSNNEWMWWVSEVIE